MAEEANLTIVINARDNASAALAGVESAVAKLQSAEQKSVKTGQESDKGLKSIGQTALETAKGISNTVQEVGGFVDGLGKIKKATEAGGVLAKFAPALSAIVSTAGPAALAIAGVTAAVGVGKVAYDAWYNSQYNWSQGLSEGNAQIADSLNKYKELIAIQNEIQDLKLIIENPESSREQVENAKQKIEEIKQLLSQEYNLVINSDNSNLEEAVAQEKKLSKDELQRNINNQIGKLNKLSVKNNTYEEDLQEEKTKYDKQLSLQSKYGNMLLQISEIDSNFEKGTKEHKQAIYDLAKSWGFTEETAKSYSNVLREVKMQYGGATNAVNEQKAKIDALNSAHNEYIAIATEISNWSTELIGIAAKEGDWEEIQENLTRMGVLIRNAGLDMSGYAQAAAMAMSGTESLNEVWEAGGTRLDNFVNNYVTAMNEFGASGEQTAIGATLIKNGFNDLTQATEAGKLNVIVQQANELAHALGLIPEEKNIEINAEGNVTLVESVEAKVKSLDGKTFAVTVDTNGDTSKLDEASKKIIELDGKRCTIVMTADGKPAIAEIDGVDYKLKNYNNETGTATLIAENGEAIGVIDFTTGQIFAMNSVVGIGHIKALDETAPGVTSAQNNINSVQGKEVTITAKFTGISGLLLNPETRNSFSIDSNEKGTQNFGGGLALVNDERGISDPRELIIDKGRAFIPQGRDVLIPLSRGAKVYTASQTKAMMSALGIPRYASGKDNSEEFISVRDNWDHYTKTHAVTTLEELKKWVELSEQFTWNEQDRLDIEEQIFSLSQKYTEELNEQSKSYISDRTFLNDWEEYGDSAEDAFSRVQKRNKTLFDEGKITWEEYAKTMSDVGSNMYDERRSQSERWLEHEEEYNNMSVFDYLSGIDRMKEYTQEYYEMGIIDKRQYIEEMTSLDEQYIDKSREAVSDRFDTSMSWIGEHTYFNDWDEITDSPLDAYNRVKDYILESDLSEKEKIEQLKSLSSQMYDERKKQSLNWLEEQRKYFGMTEDEYIAGLERIAKYTQEYFDLGLISRQEYNESMTELKHTIWDEEASIYDDLLAEQSEYISNLRAKFSEEEQALQDSWTVEDREESLSDINRQLDIYRNAVTEQGKEKYQSLLDEKKRLEREEELYNLQKSNNETIEKLQQQYNYLEENKADMLLSLRNGTFDINETERLMQRSIESANNSLTLAAADSNNFLRDIYNALRELPKTMSGGGGSTYNDSRNINITTWDSGNGIYKYINGEFSGLGSYMYNGKVY